MGTLANPGRDMLPCGHTAAPGTNGIIGKGISDAFTCPEGMWEGPARKEKGAVPRVAVTLGPNCIIRAFLSACCLCNDMPTPDARTSGGGMLCLMTLAHRHPNDVE